MEHVCGSTGTRPKTPYHASGQVEEPPFGAPFREDLQKIDGSARLVHLPSEMLSQVASHLDAKSYTNFRASCQRVRSALDSPGRINERLKSNQTRCMGLYRLSAQGKLPSLIEDCSAIVRYALSKTCHHWTRCIQNQTEMVAVLMFAPNNSPTDRKENNLIAGVLERIDRDMREKHNPDGEEQISRYSTHGGSEAFSSNYACHIIGINKAKIDPDLLPALLNTTNEIFQAATNAEKLVTSSFLVHLLNALKSQPETARLLDEHRKGMFAQHPELMHFANEVGQWQNLKKI